MNVSLLKVITMLSCFIGAVCGFIALLPYIGGFAFFTLMCLASVIVMIFLMKLRVLNLESVPESITIGGIIGFVSYLAFSIIYIPCTVILIRFFKYATNYGIALTLGHSNLFVIITISLFLAILSATINAFTGFLIYYIAETFKNMSNRG
ncbi:hypothetical protein IKP85_07085 [bacterium]|nr:hypothetical protein [bacterium]